MTSEAMMREPLDTIFNGGAASRKRLRAVLRSDGQPLREQAQFTAPPSFPTSSRKDVSA